MTISKSLKLVHFRKDQGPENYRSFPHYFKIEVSYENHCTTVPQCIVYFFQKKSIDIPVDTGRKLDVHKTFRRRPKICSRFVKLIETPTQAKLRNSKT